MEIAAIAPLNLTLTFTLLTHNMWCHYLASSPNKVHRMHAFMGEVGKYNYDVVLLQELFIINVLGVIAGGDLRSYVTDEFKKLGYDYQAIGTPPPYLFGQTSGLMMFSKHPIVMYQERRWYRADDFGTGKGYIHALLNINNTNVHFFNVHLDAHGWPARKEQLKVLVEDLPKPYSANHVIVSGDYNIDFNDTVEYNEMMELFTPREMHDIYDGEYVATHQNGKDIDHVVASNSFTIVDKRIMKFVDKRGDGISDHFGISATFGL